MRPPYSSTASDERLGVNQLISELIDADNRTRAGVLLADLGIAVGGLVARGGMGEIAEAGAKLARGRARLRQDASKPDVGLDGQLEALGERLAECLASHVASAGVLEEREAMETLRGRVLALIADGMDRPTEIARNLGVHPSQISRVARSLSSEGLIDVLSAENDRRGRIFRLTRASGTSSQRSPEASGQRVEPLARAVHQVESQFGKGSVMRMGENLNLGIESISTGAMALDMALGVGGLPRGRIVEIYGPESSGKSTLAMHVVAEAQRNGGICAYIDAEHAMDPVYAGAIGVNVDDLLISQPDTGEQALEIADMLIRSGALDVLVIDSVAALTPRAEIEGEMGDTYVGLQARLMSQALRKLTGTLSKTDTIAIFINQLREKIGVMYGSPEVTPGGRALKFYSSVRLDIRRIEQIKDGAEVVGSRTRVKVVKNKVSSPFKQAEFDIMYGRGISREGSLLDVGIDLGLIKKSGAWFTYEGEQLGQGRENAKQFLMETPEFMIELDERIRHYLGAGRKEPGESARSTPTSREEESTTKSWS